MNLHRWSLRAASRGPARVFFFALLVTAIVVGALMPNSLRRELQSHLWQGIPWSAIGHFVLFALLAACPIYGRGPGRWERAALVAIVLAIGTEMMQGWIPGRYPRVRDVGLDMCGTLAGLLVARWWLRTGKMTPPDTKTD